MTDYNQYLSWLEETFDRYSQGKAIYEVCVNVLKESPGAELIVSPANLGDTVFIIKILVNTIMITPVPVIKLNSLLFPIIFNNAHMAIIGALINNCNPILSNISI